MQDARAAAAPVADPVAPAAASPLLDVFAQADVAVERGEGVHVFDAQGRRYLDCYGGHAVAALGYGHPELCRVLDAQARKLFFQSNLFDLEIRRRAAARLVSLAPPGLTKVFFVNSGAEANENALRVAFLATKRARVVCVEGGFHGRTAAAGALTAGHEAWYGFPRAPFATTVVPFDDAAALAAAVDDSVAAIVFEPVQGWAGARPLSPAFVRTAREAADRTGAVLVFDEVQCGVGRTGRVFAAEAYGVAPDLLTTAKGVAGGFPAAALLVSERLAAGVKKGDLGTTFGGGPLAAALVDATLRIVSDPALLARVRRLSDRIRAEAVVGPVVATQGAGFLLGLRTRPPAKVVLADLRARGVLAGGAGDPHVVRLLPPLVLEDAHVDELVAALASCPG